MSKLSSKVITAPITINLNGVSPKGLKNRLRILFGKPVADNFIITDCIFYQGTPVPSTFWKRIYFCSLVLRGKVKAIEKRDPEPSIIIKDGFNDSR